MPDLSTWSRENLERLALELYQALLESQKDNKIILNAWRKEIWTKENDGS